MCAQSIIKSITPVEQETEVILNPFHLWLGLRLGLRVGGTFHLCLPFQVGAIACKEGNHFQEATRLCVKLKLLCLL